MKYRYSDLGIAFTRHPVTKDVVRLYDDESVKQSVKNLIMNQFYDAPMQPKKGNSVRGILFEPVSPLTVSMLRNEIVDLINRYEPRIIKLNVGVDLTSTENEYNVRVEFTVINLPLPIIIDLLLTRVR